MRNGSVLSLLLVTLLACGAHADYLGVGNFNITLLATSASEVPAITNTTGVGNATVQLSMSGSQACFNLISISPGIATLNAGHIHRGNASVAGPVVITLFNSSTSQGAQACVSVAQGVLSDIQLNPSEYYFNGHNADFPNGVVRGQVGSPFGIALDGAAEVPPTNASDTAAISITIGYNYVCYDSLVLNGSASVATSTLVAGHIHKGDFSVAGPVSVVLFNGAPPSISCTTVAPALALDIASDPDNYYANLHSAAFPNGVVRGQMVLGTAMYQAVYATSDMEVPPANGTGGRGNGTAVIYATGNVVCFNNVTVSPGIATPTAAHIHRGNASLAGPVVVTLFSGNFVTQGCVTVSPALIAAMSADPFNYYYNVHNADYPNGVVRAQFGATVRVPLSSAKEVPVPPGASSTGSVYITISIGYVCYLLPQVSNTTDGTNLVPSLTAGHIHSGDRTVAGPVVVTLFNGAPLQSGCTNLSQALGADIATNPQNYYVNVHSAAYPAGVARGQLTDGLTGFISPVVTTPSATPARAPTAAPNATTVPTPTTAGATPSPTIAPNSTATATAATGLLSLAAAIAVAALV